MEFSKLKAYTLATIEFLLPLGPVYPRDVFAMMEQPCNDLIRKALRELILDGQIAIDIEWDEEITIPGRINI